MSQQNLIASPAERKTRKEEKEQQILRFLRDQIWSTADVLSNVINVKTRQAIHQTLMRLEKSGLIARHQIESLGGKKTIWGITNQGQMVTFDLNAEEAPNPNYFEPSRIAESTAHHHLGIQKIRLIAEQEGYTGWVDGNTLKTVAKDGKRPDALITSPQGLRIAIEYERSFKTIKRYAKILSTYLQAIKRNDFDQIVWISPCPITSKRLRRIILGIELVAVQGQRIKVDPVKHHEKLSFIPLDNLADFLKKSEN